MADLSFIKDFEKQAAKMDNVSSESGPPRYMYSTGNHVLNYIISGDFHTGIPQGRITCIAGPSGAGKTFIQCNAVMQSQLKDTYVLMLDSENAVDDGFAEKIGIDVNVDYNYKGVVTIGDTLALLSTFIKGYKKTYGNDPNAPKVLVVIDSLDMLLTDTELNNFEKGDNKGDQGQRAKQTKALLRNMVQQIKDLNIAMIVTHQVYAATQDMILKGQSDGNWVINGAVKYSLSQLILVTKLKLKADSDIVGIKMKCQAVKTRFTKPFQDVTIEVPYETGMDPYSGLKDAAMMLGVLEKKGSYVKVVGEEVQFYAKDIGDHSGLIFEKIAALGEVDLSMTETLGLEEDMNVKSEAQIKKERKDTSRLEQAVKDRNERKAVKNAEE